MDASEPAAQGVIEPLSASDVPANVALARAVGWHDVEADWRVLHAAARVLGVRQAGRVVAQGALGSFGSVGTIAKMIVAKDFQRQGLGARLLDELLASAESTGHRALGLVATPLGQPLYATRQFRLVGEVVVMAGTPHALSGAARALEGIEAAIAADQRWLGCSRRTMLEARAREAHARAGAYDAAGRLRGYGLATQQQSLALVGPILAESEDEARQVAAAIFAAVAGPVRIDVPATQTGFRGWLLAHGLSELGTRPEMARGADRLPWQAPERFALATQAWG